MSKLDYVLLCFMDSDDYLQLSGIQHFAFCKRQWAIIHIEQQWQENWRTSEGKYLHRNVDNPSYNETRKDVVITRAVPLISHRLRLSGIADVVEYHRSLSGIELPRREGLYSIVPVEYKFGQKKNGEYDEVQLCAQAFCLEEMFDTKIPFGYLYYGKTRRRFKVSFNEQLRLRVEELVAEMYHYYENTITPQAVYRNSCENCSLMHICLPKISENKKSVKSYIQSIIMGGKDA